MQTFKNCTYKVNFIYLGKNIFASLIVTYRYGREEDEVMGVSFKKELVVDRVQVYPGNQEEEKAKFQVTIHASKIISRHFSLLMNDLILRKSRKSKLWEPFVICLLGI